jgi:hypothetical protein
MAMFDSTRDGSRHAGPTGWWDDFHVRPEERQEIDAWLARILPDPLDQASLRRILTKAGLNDQAWTRDSHAGTDTGRLVERRAAHHARAMPSGRTPRSLTARTRPRAFAEAQSSWRQGVACLCVGIASVLCLNLPILSGSHLDERGQSVSLGRFHW